MTAHAILEAQDYLTMEKDGELRQILDIGGLLKKHSPEEVITFLREYLREKEKALKNLILIDKTQKRVDETVAAMFRMYMAIKILEEDGDIVKISKGKEVIDFGVEQGAGNGGEIHQRDSSRDSSAGERKDTHHDGEDRNTGDGAQRAA